MIPKQNRLPDLTGLSPLAYYWGNETTQSKEFTSWDCERAGADGAPASALCGAGTDEAYKLLLSLASRGAIGSDCKWPARPDLEPKLKEVLAFAQKSGKADQFKADYDEHYRRSSTAREDNPGYDCRKYLGVLNKMVDDNYRDWKAALNTGK
jgi:hypothetical protein